MAHRRKYFFAAQTEFTCYVKNIYSLITKKTKVIFIANPNNPTGTIITHTQLENLLKNISEKILIVIDEAYYEYVTDKSFPGSIALQKKYPNLIILRTFSKIYGLAGLRIGYAIAEKTIADSLKKNRIPFFFNSLSEDAALTALSDDKFIKKCAKANERERKYLFTELKTAGYNVVESQANFLFLYFISEEEKENIFKRLSDEGLMICNLKIFGQGQSLRISIADRQTNNRIVSCVRISEALNKEK